MIAGNTQIIQLASTELEKVDSEYTAYTCDCCRMRPGWLLEVHQGSSLPKIPQLGTTLAGLVHPPKNMQIRAEQSGTY